MTEHLGGCLAYTACVRTRFRCGELGMSHILEQTWRPHEGEGASSEANGLFTFANEAEVLMLTRTRTLQLRAVIIF